MALSIAYIVLAMVGTIVSTSSIGGYAHQNLPDLSSGALTCPDPAELVPCICYGNTTGHYLDCSQVVDEDQLAAILSKPFPLEVFSAFIMYSNPAITTLQPADFGQATFEEFVINDGVLEDIHNETFANSYKTVRTIQLYNNRISRFPFHELASFSRLQHLDISYNHIQQLPLLDSRTLVALNTAGNTLKEVPAAALQQLPSLQAAIFYGNGLTHVQPGALTGLAELRLIDLANNRLSHLAARTIHLTTNEYTLIALSFNRIVHLDIDAIKVSGPGMVFLDDNLLTELREDVFRPLVETGTYLLLGGNPWVCGCDLLWLLESDSFKSQIIDSPRCVDGTFMLNINPDSIDHNCIR